MAHKNIMIRTQQTYAHSLHPKVAPKTFVNLLFWQGYFFAIGVGGLLLSLASFLGKDNLIALLCHSFALYGGGVGYAAASVWRMPNGQTPVSSRAYSKYPFAYAVLLCIPLVLFRLYQEIGGRLSSELTPDDFQRTCFHGSFCVLFAMAGIWLGSSKEEPRKNTL
jgi:hypothetical protein